MRTREEQEAINQACKYHPATKTELILLLEVSEVKLNDIDTSKITDMSELFAYEKYRYDWNGLELWDTSNVTDMSQMFYKCCNFNYSLNTWNVANVTDMHSLFAGCRAFNQSLNAWDVSKVTSMFNLFYGCENFNQPLDNWNVANVEDMLEMFSYCPNFNQDIGGWNVEKVQDMSYMFQSCEKFNQNLNKWSVNKRCKTFNIFFNAGQDLFNANKAFTTEQLLKSLTTNEEVEIDDLESLTEQNFWEQSFNVTNEIEDGVQNGV